MKQPSGCFALNTSRTDADVQSTFSERVGTWTLCSTDGTEDLHEAKGEGYATYTNPLWPNGLDWMKLPPGTHLLLYGRGSMGAMFVLSVAGRFQIVRHSD